MGFGRSCCKVFTVSLVPVTVLILSIVFFLGIVLLPALYTELAVKEQYGIVIDAGSSHTHIYLYQWRVSSLNQTSQVKQITTCRPLGSGISTYTNATAAGESICLCLEGILRHVPKGYRNDVNVWVGATAGMRLLRIENKTHSEEILKSLRKTLGNLKLHHHSVRILSGGEEGAGGWITANYLQNNLQKPSLTKRYVTPVMSTGALDMGGASMQIAFQQSSPPVNHSFTAELFGQNFNLYSRSYLCFGVNEAFRRTLAYLTKENGYLHADAIHNPCLNKGINFTRNMSYLFDNHTCTNDLVPTPPSSYNGSMLINFNGTSNSTECQELLERAMNFSQCFNNDSTVVDCGDDRIPSVKEDTFLAFSEFYYIMDFFNISSLNGSSFSMLNSNITKFCDSTWKEIVRNRTSVRYLMDKCFQSLYVSHALQNGLGFKPNGKWNISFEQQINTIDAGWTLGYMLNRTNSILPTPNNINYPYSSPDLIVGMVVLTILTVVFIIFFIFTFSACRKALKPIATGYTNIS